MPTPTTYTLHGLPEHVRLLLLELDRTLGCHLGDPIGEIPSEIQPGVPFKADLTFPHFSPIPNCRVVIHAMMRQSPDHAIRIDNIIVDATIDPTAKKDMAVSFLTILFQIGGARQDGNIDSKIRAELDYPAIGRMREFHYLVSLSNRVRAACE